jgi:hypothetical protein
VARVLGQCRAAAALISPVVTPRELTRHPNGEPLPAVRAVAARVTVTGAGVLRFEYRVSGDLADLAIPRHAPSARAERLWEHTCFEAFVAAGTGGGYCELNFSPSTEWAAYAFDGYRQGMRPLALATPPTIAVVNAAREVSVTASVEIGALAAAPWPWRVGLTAVVADRAGRRGYFALCHPRDEADFHDAAGFAVLLDGSAR